jgi:N-acetyl-gamma-glutamyl-phosphate/LysW-gamma-L-alpha-aminoadipyl-6-phosphate reductase
MEQVTASIVGGSGYAGGELLRLLLFHPNVTIQQVTSERQAGKYVRAMHPNLRGRTDLQFTPMDSLEKSDILFLCTPHGVTMEKIGGFLDKANVIIDLSADFRLRNPDDYVTWYGHTHTNPALLNEFVYGIPELHRAEMRDARYIASGGCNATAAILGLYPLAQAGVLDPNMPIVIESKTGSSGAGGESGLASHHPERSGVIRPFKPTGHRHSAEVIQELTADGRVPQVGMSVTSVEAVRGILATSHVFLKDDLQDRDLWKIYRAAYKNEPFMRIVKEAGGIHRNPEPKVLTGSNYCDVGFERDPHSKRVVVLAAIDNLMKGASGQAVQAMNIRCGFPEDTSLEFPGLHPV